MSLLESIGFSEVEIKSQVEQICIEKKIDYIVPLAKKGNVLFKDIFGDKDLTINGNVIKVFNDRLINKFDSFSFLSNKNILIFDDSFRTGNRIFKTISFFLDKTMSSLIKEKKDIVFNEFGDVTNYSYYTVVQCKKEDVPNRKNFKVKSYKTYNTEDYYDFCIKEATIFQKKLCYNSIDLPIFKTSVNDLQLLNDIFQNELGMEFEETYTYIGNEKVNLGVLYIDIPELRDLTNNLILATTCKLRYEINKDGQYDCIFTPLIFTQSMEYSDLENMYNSIFNLERRKASLKVDMRLSFVKLYRYINYVLSFSIGNLIKKYLAEYCIDLKYSKEFENQFIETLDGEENILLQNKLKEYENFNNVLKDLSNFKCESDYYLDEDSSFVLSFDEIKETIFNLITEEREKSNLEHNFTPIEDFSNIYSNPKNYFNFVKAIYQCLESYSITNELDFINSKSYLERGFVNGECSAISLPYKDKVFYVGLRCFYDKVNRDYDKYVKNYNLFIEKYYHFLLSEDYFKNNLITKKEFVYFENYYRNVSKNSIKKKLESKTYILKQKDMQVNINYIKPRVEFFLNSDDFEF